MSERYRLRVTLWATTGFVLLQFGWLILMAPFAGIDEFDHAKRANSVASGHLLAKDEGMPGKLARGDLIPVRTDIAAAANPACINLPYTYTYDCWPAKDLHNGEVLIGSAAARYNPTFYVIAGLVASPFHGNASLYAMRLTSIVICGVLFALTLHLTNSWARTLWPTLTCLIAALPTTIYSTTLAAPNGTNMIAGMALWAALLHRIKKDDSGVLAYLVMCASAALLVNTHTLGAVWFALTIVACSCLVGPWKLIALVRPRTRLEAFAAMGTALATVFEFAWLIAVRPNDPAGPAIVHTNVWTLLPREMLLWPLQTVGAYPYRDEPAPTATYAAAALVLLPVLVIALRAVQTVPRLRMTVGIVVLTSYAVPIGLTVATFSRIGLNWQGRYGMPYAVGFFLLLGLALDHAGVRVRRVLVETGIALWVVADVVSQSQVLTRQGSDPVLARTGWWVPSQALIMVLGLGAWLAWRRIALEPRDPSSGNRQPFRRGDSRTAVT